MTIYYKCHLCDYGVTNPILFKQHMSEHNSHWWVHHALGYGFGRYK